MSDAEPRPFPDSLCHRCRHLRVVESARSSFLLCRKLDVKYPRQPVRACDAFEPGQFGAPSFTQS